MACRHAIDPAEITRPQAVTLPTASAPGTILRPEAVRYPWRIFFAVLGIAFLLALSSKDSGGNKGLSWRWWASRPLPVSGCFSMRSGSASPGRWRWAVGSMFLPVVIFPWYLARRRAPQSPVPFVETEVGPVTRFLLFALLLFFLVSLIFYIVQGPPSATAPTPPPKLQTPGGSSPSRITNLHPWEKGGRRGVPGEKARPLPGASNAQAETSAPSDAWQT